MRIIPCEQGTLEWVTARLGIPTASQFHRIITPRGRLSSQAQAYMNELLAERIINQPATAETSKWMERGKALESEAADWYAMMASCEPVRVGFCLHDEVNAGASPDRLIGDDGLLEVKCPTAATHIGYLRSGIGAESDHWVQVQGQLWVTGRAWADVLSYCPGISPAGFVVRVYASPDATLVGEAVRSFSIELESAYHDLLNKVSAEGLGALGGRDPATA